MIMMITTMVMVIMMVMMMALSGTTGEDDNDGEDDNACCDKGKDAGSDTYEDSGVSDGDEDSLVVTAIRCLMAMQMPIKMATMKNDGNDANDEQECRVKTQKV